MDCFDLFQSKKVVPVPPNAENSSSSINVRTFTFEELATATRGFGPESFLREGESSKIYKGLIESTGQVVAVKRLDRNEHHNRKFLVEVLMLGLLQHPNLVRLVGYCAQGDERLLVLEYIPFGSLEDHLHDLPPNKEPLDWITRLKIAVGVAKGLEYLNDKANPPVIYRGFKTSHVLLDKDFQPKLSSFGLAKLGPLDHESHVSTRVIGFVGYCDPEYAMTGRLTVKSDVYSFGVVLLELITGRKAFDGTKPDGEQNLVEWVLPKLKSDDQREILNLADPRLQGRFHKHGLIRALAVAHTCVKDEAAGRPPIADVVTALTYLASQPYEP